MANSILTPTMITREALRIVHDNLNFLGNVTRRYDDQFAQSGAKIGTSLNVRLPAKYSVRTGATLSAQDHVERSTPLQVTTQYGIDVSFTSVELTMSLDTFSKTVLAPQVRQLASKIEADCLSVAYKLVPNFVGATNTSMTYKDMANLGRQMTESVVPRGDRSACISPLSMVEFSDATKGLFQDSNAIQRQWREGLMGRTAGFDIYDNNLIPAHTIGTLAGTPLTTGAALGTSTTANSWVSQTDMSVDGANTGTTLKAGDVLTFGTIAAGLNDCHPETKASYGRLKKFVVQADVTLTTQANTYTVTVKPGVIYGTGNAYQNCILTNANTDNMTVTNFGAAGSAVGQDLVFHEDAFVFATADLEDVSKYGAWGARDTQDGISIRIARNYDIVNDRFPCRLDVLWGFAGLYAADGFASRHIHAQG